MKNRKKKRPGAYYELEGRAMDEVKMKFPESNIISNIEIGLRKGTAIILPVRVGLPAEVGGFSRNAAVAIEEAIWLRDRFEHFRKGESS